MNYHCPRPPKQPAFDTSLLMWRRRLLGGAAPDVYAVAANSPEFVADFAGVLNSGTEYYRSGGSDTTFSSVFTHSGLVLPATMTDSDGVMKWAPHNLTSYSEQLDNAYWPKTTGAVTANSIAAPDGETTGDLFVPSASASSAHRIFKDFGSSFPQGEQMTSAVFVRAGGYEKFTLILNDANNQVKVDLGLGTITFQGSNISASSIQSYGDWYLVTITSNTIIAHRYLGFYVLPDSATMNDNSLPSWTPNGTSGVYLWGAHVYRSDLGGMVNNPDRGDSYVPTTTAARFLPRRNHHLFNGSTYDNAGILIEPAAATNLATYSNDFTNAAWINGGSTDASNQTTGPDGQTSADKITAVGGSGVKTIRQVLSLTSGVTYCFSMYVKESTSNGVGLLIFDGTNGTAHKFNLTTETEYTAETFGSPPTVVSKGIEDVGGGWYRCHTAIVANSTASWDVYIYILNASGARAYTTSGTPEALFLYGAQFEAGSVPTSYIPVVAGSTVTRAAETLTVAGANLPYSATAMSFNMKGTISYADTGTAVQAIFYDWRQSFNTYILAQLRDDGVNISEVEAQQRTASYTAGVFSSSNPYAPGINVPFSMASRNTNDIINVAAEGAASSENSTPTGMPGLSAAALSICNSGVFTASLFRMWGADIGDSGIETAST